MFCHFCNHTVRCAKIAACLFSLAEKCTNGAVFDAKNANGDANSVDPKSKRSNIVVIVNFTVNDILESLALRQSNSGIIGERLLGANGPRERHRAKF